MGDRENLLRLALDLAAVADALEQAPVVNADLAFAAERVEGMQVIVEEMLREVDQD